MTLTKDIAVVFDCGATNLRVIAINTDGEIVSSLSFPNETNEDPFYIGGKIWDLEKIWKKLCTASTIVTSKIDKNRIAGVTVTTFGVDGTFVNKNGDMLYPVISWQCQRTNSVIKNIDKYISLTDLYNISGVYPYSFNTINKLIWMNENKPDVCDKSSRFLFISSLLIHKLSGVMQNDTTMMGTSMLADLEKRNFSETILNAIGFDRDLFGDLGEPGDEVGVITKNASKETGLPEKTPVFRAGHDTQFAIFGSGAQLNQLVLSSGTWEILMARSSHFSASPAALKNKLTTEADAISGVYNIGQNWLGSGVLEWVSDHFYPELKGAEKYSKMIAEADKEEPGSGGLVVDPTFYYDDTDHNGGMIKGLSIETTRSQVYRSFLEGLSFRLKEGLEAVETSGNFKAERIICVGGGSKNKLWNKLRANICQKPIQLIDQKETTVLGASLFVFYGAKFYQSVDEARTRIKYNPQIILPEAGKIKIWEELYDKYKQLKSQD